LSSAVSCSIWEARARSVAASFSRTPARSSASPAFLFASPASTLDCAMVASDSRFSMALISSSIATIRSCFGFIRSSMFNTFLWENHEIAPSNTAPIANHIYKLFQPACFDFSRVKSFWRSVRSFVSDWTWGDWVGGGLWGVVLVIVAFGTRMQIKSSKTRI